MLHSCLKSLILTALWFCSLARAKYIFLQSFKVGKLFPAFPSFLPYLHFCTIFWAILFTFSFPLLLDTLRSTGRSQRKRRVILSFVSVFVFSLCDATLSQGCNGQLDLLTNTEQVRKCLKSLGRILGALSKVKKIFLGCPWWGLDWDVDCGTVLRAALWAAEVTIDWAHSLVFHIMLLHFLSWVSTWKVFI